MRLSIYWTDLTIEEGLAFHAYIRIIGAEGKSCDRVCTFVNFSNANIKLESTSSIITYLHHLF